MFPHGSPSRFMKNPHSHSQNDLSVYSRHQPGKYTPSDNVTPSGSYPSSPRLSRSSSAAANPLRKGTSSEAEPALSFVSNIFRQSPSSFRWAFNALLDHYHEFATLTPHKVGQRAGKKGKFNKQGKVVVDSDASSSDSDAQSSDSDSDSDSNSDSDAHSEAEQDSDSDSDSEQAKKKKKKQTDNDDDNDAEAENDLAKTHDLSMVQSNWCDCCNIAWWSTWSIMWSAFQSGGVPSLLARLHSHFVWGCKRSEHFCDASENRTALDCGGIACYFINMAQAVKKQAEWMERELTGRMAPSIPSFPFHVLGCQLILSSSPEENRRWLRSAKYASGDQFWIGSGDSGIVYHQCMALVREDDGWLWLYDDGKLLLPPNNHTAQRRILALKLVQIKDSMPQKFKLLAKQKVEELKKKQQDEVDAALAQATERVHIEEVTEEKAKTAAEQQDNSSSSSSATTTAFPTSVQYYQYRLKTEQWYSWLPETYDLQSPDIINLPLGEQVEMPRSECQETTSVSRSNSSSNPFAQIMITHHNHSSAASDTASTTSSLSDDEHDSESPAGSSALWPAPTPCAVTALSSSVTVFVSGCAMNDDNPAPGSGVGRALRMGSLKRDQMGTYVRVFQPANEDKPTAAQEIPRGLASPFHLHLVGVDYSLLSAGVECEAFDESLIIDAWEAHTTPKIHTADVLGHLRAHPLAFWLPASDAEVTLLATGLKDKVCQDGSQPVDWSQPAQRVLIPPLSALDWTAKPCLQVAATLGMHVPPSLVIRRSEDASLSHHSIYNFCAMQRGPFWVKGETIGVIKCMGYGDTVRGIVAMQAAVEQDVLVQCSVQGIGKGIAFAAVAGELTAALMLTKTQVTALMKGWGGMLEAVPPALLQRIRTLVKELNWTGGGELEYLEGLDGRLYFIDFNARFPAWIYASTLANVNLPQALVQHAIHKYSKQYLEQQASMTAAPNAVQPPSTSSSSLQAPSATGMKKSSSRSDMSKRPVSPGFGNSSSSGMATPNPTSLFQHVMPFPHHVYSQSISPLLRVQYTRSIVEVVSHVQPPMMQTTFDVGIAGVDTRFPHPARLVELVKAAAQDKKSSSGSGSSDKDKKKKKKGDKKKKKNVVSDDSDSDNSASSDSDNDEDEKPRHKSKSKSKKEKKSKKNKKSKSKKEDANKVGEGYDKYLPLLPTYWFDGGFAADQAKAKKKADKESRKEKENKDTAVVLSSNALNPLDMFRATPISSDFKEQRLTSFNGRKTQTNSNLANPASGEKLWCMPALHADIPDVLSGLSVLLPKLHDLSSLPTPCFIVSSSLVQRFVGQFQRAFSLGAVRAGIANAVISMSVKTQPLASVLLAGKAVGAIAECISLGEVRKALAVGFAPHEIIFNGPAKNVDSTQHMSVIPLGHQGLTALKPHQRALGNLTAQQVYPSHSGSGNGNEVSIPKLRCVNSDSLAELELLVDAVLDPTHYIKSSGVGVRLTPVLHASRFGSSGVAYHAQLSQSLQLNGYGASASSSSSASSSTAAKRDVDDSEGGHSTSAGDDVLSLLSSFAAQLSRLPVETVLGVHYHFASSTLGWPQWVSQIHGVISQAVLLEELLSQYGRHLSYFDLGGGFPAGLIHQPVLQAQLSDVLVYLKQQLPHVQSVYLEPGKALSERAGGMLTTVQYVREVCLDSAAKKGVANKLVKLNKQQIKADKKKAKVAAEINDANTTSTSTSTSTTTTSTSLTVNESQQRRLLEGVERPPETAVVDACICDLGSLPTHAHPLFYLQASKLTDKDIQLSKAAAASASVEVEAKSEDVSTTPQAANSPSWQLFPSGHSSIYGRICMEWDILGFGVRFPTEGLQPGDKVFMANTGAYDMSMNYGFGRGQEGKDQIKANAQDQKQQGQTQVEMGVYIVP